MISTAMNPSSAESNIVVQNEQLYASNRYPATTHSAATQVVLVPCERLDAFTAHEWRKEAGSYLDRGVADLVVDLSDTAFLDSAGMAALVSLLKQARRQGGDVKLIWPRREPVQRILRLTRFDRVFEILPAA